VGNFVNFLRTDLFAIVACAFLFVIWQMLPWVNDPSKASQEVVQSEGKLYFEAEWPANRNVDVDLWVQSPGEPPVGYSNKGWVNCNLLRDDLGWKSDPMVGNHESTVCRALKEGHWVANLHYFSGDGQGKIVANATIRLIRPNGTSKLIARKVLTLNNPGHEDTIVQFDLSARGEVSNVTTIRHSFNLTAQGDGL